MIELIISIASAYIYLGDICPHFIIVKDRPHWLYIAPTAHGDWLVGYKSNEMTLAQIIVMDESERVARSNMFIYLLKNKMIKLCTPSTTSSQ